MDPKNLAKDFVVSNPLGIHARPASVFVQAAADFESEITVTNLDSGHIADGKSVMSMLMLSAPKGARIRVEISGRDADKAMEILSALIEGGFDE
ncbi:MAG: HPr family phosphocarrier protein [Succinivibrio dextrinosolvens]|jgi:phosphotransferase system HPr (HPr) family protein|nr:HPr family phosphocarrier protein [Succinivibrio dextrinosolvens]